jgi:hypothetical protein
MKSRNLIISKITTMTMVMEITKKGNDKMPIYMKKVMMK